MAEILNGYVAVSTSKAALEDPSATLLLIDVQGGPLVAAKYAASQPAPEFTGCGVWCVRVQQPGHVMRVAPESAGLGSVEVVVGRGEEVGRITDALRVVAHRTKGPQSQRGRRGKGTAEAGIEDS